MSGLADILLDSICHRSGEYADVLPLCVRCSGVYAGVLLGAVLESALRSVGKAAPNRFALFVNVSALAVMGVAGLGGLYGFIQVPTGVKVFVTLFFGTAIAFFAVSAIAHELGAEGARKPAQGIFRAILVGLLGLAAAGVAAGFGWVLRLLGLLTAAGILATFLLVNFAFALILLRGKRGKLWRVAMSLLLVPGLAAAEFALFALWRRIL